MAAPWFDPEHYRSDSNQRWRHGCPHEELARGRVRVAPAARRIRRSGPIDGATMGETMESFLDADRAARLEHLRADRIDLA